MRLESFNIFLKVIKADLYRYRCASGIKGFLKAYFRKPGFRYIFWMRLTRYLDDKKLLKVIYWLASRKRSRLVVKYGMCIPHMTTIGPGLFIGHFGGIVVNEATTIGKNCNLSHGVTIGRKIRGKFQGCPTIGDSVYIGPGVCIIGSVSIGNNIAIGANAVIVDNVGDNEVVVLGNPSRTVSKKGSEDYVRWVKEDANNEK